MQNTSSRQQTLLTKCIICETDIRSEKLVQNPREESLTRLLEFTKERGCTEGESKYVTAWKRLERESVFTLIERGAKYHRSCYKELTNKEHLQRARSARALKLGQLQKGVEANAEQEERRTRSGVKVSTKVCKRIEAMETRGCTFKMFLNDALFCAIFKYYHFVIVAMIQDDTSTSCKTACFEMLHVNHTSLEIAKNLLVASFYIR